MRGINRIWAAASVFVVAAALGAVASVGGVDGETTERTTGRAMKAVAKENRYALIIGVDYFPNLPTQEMNEQVAPDAVERPSDKYDLNCCVLDARRLAAALVEHAGFATENVDAMTFQKGDELDPNDPTVPTAENIRRKIDALAGTLEADDMLLVAFSGHGVMFGVESNDDPERRSYLCACDADLDRRSTFVDRKALLETLKKCRAERKLFIADCCRDFFELNEGARARGRAFGSRSMGAANPFETGNYGFAQISACRAGQQALETEGVGGLFTSALIDGLRRGANASGELSLTAWFDYTKAQTTERSRAMLASEPTLGAVDEKTGARQKEQEPTLYLLGETPGWIFADGLPVDGLPADVWAKADALFDEASKIRGRLRAGTIRSNGVGAESARVAERRSAQAKIAEALELTAEAGESSVRRAKYVAEEARLTKWATTEAKRLAEAALEAFKKGEGGDEASVQTAITLMEEALALNDEPGNGYLLTTFKAKLVELQKEPDWTDAPPAGTRKTLEIAGVEYAFRYCPAGAFLMGSPESETGRDSDETQHRIALDGFWMLETEVTVGMWRSFVGATNYKTGDGYGGKGGWGYDVETGKREQNHKYTWENPGFSQTDEHPITQVDYPGAVAFCEWLAKETGEPIRLPTEAEWERACRAETKTAYSFGDDAEDLTKYGNVADKSAKAKFPELTTFSGDDGYVFTAPVKSFEPNAWNLYDMHGNVWEWCADRYGEYDATDQINPAGAKSGVNRLVRGGSWFEGDVKENRSANRSDDRRRNRHFDTGFRLVLGDLPAKETKAEERTNESLRATAGKGTRRAVLIGIEEYDYLETVADGWVRYDFERVQEILIENGFKQENIEILIDNEHFEAPTKANIERALTRLCEEAQPEDEILAWFNGLGVCVDGRDFFAPVDVKADLEKWKVEGLVSLDLALAELVRCPAKHKFCVYDADRDGNELEIVGFDVKAITPADSILAKDGGWTLYACSFDEVAWALSDIKGGGATGGGLLTRAFLEGTTELGDADGDGVVTAMEACRYAMKKTSEDAKKLGFTEFRKQTPRLSVDGDDFALSLRPKKAEKKEKEENAAQGDEE